MFSTSINGITTSSSFFAPSSAMSEMPASYATSALGRPVHVAQQLNAQSITIPLQQAVANSAMRCESYLAGNATTFSFDQNFVIVKSIVTWIIQIILTVLLLLLPIDAIYMTWFQKYGLRTLFCNKMANSFINQFYLFSLIERCKTWNFCKCKRKTKDKIESGEEEDDDNDNNNEEEKEQKQEQKQNAIVDVR